MPHPHDPKHPHPAPEKPCHPVPPVQTNDEVEPPDGPPDPPK